MKTNSSSYFKELNTDRIQIRSSKENVAHTDTKQQTLSQMGSVFFNRTGEISSPDYFIGKIISIHRLILMGQRAVFQRRYYAAQEQVLKAKQATLPY